eukprot:3635515-Rhodomonas_salina.1
MLEKHIRETARARAGMLDIAYAAMLRLLTSPMYWPGEGGAAVPGRRGVRVEGEEGAGLHVR